MSRIRSLPWVCQTVRLLAICLLFAGCGGEGGDSPSGVTGAGDDPGINPVTASDRRNAAAAELTAVLDLGSNLLKLSWKDSFADGSAYAVKSQDPDGSFTTVETVGGGGTGAPVEWSRAATVTTTYRVEAVLPGRSVAVSTPQGNSTVTVAVPSVLPTIGLDQNEPVSQAVTLSIDGGPYLSVAWYVDLGFLGSGTGASGHPRVWQTATAANGPHLILARAQTTPDSYVEVRRTVSTSNSNIAVTSTVSGTAGLVDFDVRASSEWGITEVQATRNGLPLGTLAAPNAISRLADTNDIFRFTVDTRVVGSGQHTFVATAKDRMNMTATTTRIATFSNPPVLTLVTPPDGAFVSGTLAVNGSVDSDKTGPVSVVATLGAVPLLQTTTSPFATTFSLQGVVPGTYTLTVRATDSTNTSAVLQRTITVASSPTLAYAPLFTIGAAGDLLATEGDSVLYRAPDGSCRLRSASQGTETTLADAAGIARAADWQISGSKVVAYGQGPDCRRGYGYCVYQWAADGSIRNLSTGNYPIHGPVDLHPVALGPYVVWVDSMYNSSYTVYDGTSNTYRTIAKPPNVLYLGNWNYGLFIGAGGLSFIYGGATGYIGAPAFDLYRWDATTGVSTALTFGGQRNVYPQTDGTRVAWLRSPVGTTDSPTSLVVQPVGGGPETILSTNASTTFRLRDGLLAWTETENQSRALKVSTAAAVQTLSIHGSSYLLGTGGGFIVYGESGKTYGWSPSTGKTLLMDTAPSKVLMSGSTVYCVVSEAKAVYRIPLP